MDKRKIINIVAVEGETEFTNQNHYKIITLLGRYDYVLRTIMFDNNFYTKRDDVSLTKIQEARMEIEDLVNKNSLCPYNFVRAVEYIICELEDHYKL